MEPEFSPKIGALTFNSPDHDDRVFALPLTVYPPFNRFREGIRYRDRTGRIWSSFAEAEGHLGQRVEEIYA
jgi:hypothetical protein